MACGSGIPKNTIHRIKEYNVTLSGIGKKEYGELLISVHKLSEKQDE